MSSQIITEGNIKVLSYLQIGCTCILSSFALVGKDNPDIALCVLLFLCTCGNGAWVMHIEEGWGSQNALYMFQVSLSYTNDDPLLTSLLDDPSTLPPAPTLTYTQQQGGTVLGFVAFIAATYRRVKFGPPPSDDDDEYNSDDDFDQDENLSLVDVKKKADALLEIKTKMDMIKKLDAEETKATTLKKRRPQQAK